jgi:hypothetical protein
MGILIKTSVCTIIKGKKKLMVPMLDSFWKHVAPCKALVAKLKVKAREHYFLKTNTHVANEKLCVGQGPKTMFKQVIHGAI